MPQLDKFTFAPQVIWLVVIFFVLYFVLVKEGLPRLYKVLLFRKRKLLSLNTSSEIFVREIFFSKLLSINLCSSFVNKLRNLPEVGFRVVEQAYVLESNKIEVCQERVRGIMANPVNISFLKDSLDYESQITKSYKLG